MAGVVAAAAAAESKLCVFFFSTTQTSSVNKPISSSLPLLRPISRSRLSSTAFTKPHPARIPHKRRQNLFPSFLCKCISTAAPNTNYEFSDGASDVELRLPLGNQEIPRPRDVVVDAAGTSLRVTVRRAGSVVTLIETDQLFDRVKPSDTIWFIDEDELVITLKKQDPKLKWPDIVESWESLSSAGVQLLKGTSVFIVGDSTQVNRRVARELAVGLGYTPLDTQELLESVSNQTVDTWIVDEGLDSVAEAESSVLESLSSNARAVVSTLGGKHGAAGRTNNWRHLHAGFTVWVSQTVATDEATAKEEARRHVQTGHTGYSNADVVVKLRGWDPDHAKSVAQAALSALKRLVLSDKELPGKKSLYIRLGCRGDWPDIKPPGWDPSNKTQADL